MRACWAMTSNMYLVLCCNRYPDRLYSPLGVDVWMLKLKAHLAVLGGTASTFTGHVSDASLVLQQSDSCDIMATKLHVPMLQIVPQASIPRACHSCWSLWQVAHGSQSHDAAI
jgi:hypothetical protein